MNRKAFTLIELLVVITIIAILAAILFPVFAQAKVAAKKTSAIAQQKQNAVSILLYMNDADDTFPRNDDCQAGTALNTELNKRPFVRSQCFDGPYMYRMNHYSWQKWVLPYMKNTDIFAHPARPRLQAQWESNGQIMGGFALNITLTGALNTYGAGKFSRGQFRDSWLGGRQENIPDPSKTMLLFEFGNTDVNFAPVVADNALSEEPTYPVYPPAVREWWARNLMEWKKCTGWKMEEISSEPDPRATVAGGLVLGYADGRAGFVKAQKFLADTPLYREYVIGGTISNGYRCGLASGLLAWDADVNLNIDYPMWGLEKR